MKSLLQHGFMDRAQREPDATALVAADGTRLSYGRLDATSNRLAQLLVDANCGNGHRVGLLMPKRPEAIAAMLGILKADATYVPLDPSDPTARLARTLQLADCSWIIAGGPVGRALQSALAAAGLERDPLIGWLDDGSGDYGGSKPIFKADDLDAFPAVSPPSVNHGADLASILFTSGSTGVPKGVMITHAGVVHFIRWACAYFGIHNTDRISQHSRFRFDVSIFDIFGTLWAGAELHLVPRELNLLPHKLADFVRERRLTQWFSVPSVLNFMAKFDVVRNNDFPALRRVLFAGEVLPTPTLIYWMRRLPHVRFTNLYGPTETTISSSYYTIPHCPTNPRQPIPIGTACGGEELMVLDADLRPVRQGEVGDLYVRGVGVSPGYWRDAERTQRAFLANPFLAGSRDRIYKTGDRVRLEGDGLHYFCGRADTQIKSRGYRIELGEIEAALHALAQVRECAVLAIESQGFEGKLICCAYALTPGRNLTLDDLREALAADLPGYMLPMRWMRYDALPRNANGKLDRPQIAQAFLNAEKEAGAKAPPGRRNSRSPAEHDALSVTTTADIRRDTDR